MRSISAAIRLTAFFQAEPLGGVALGQGRVDVQFVQRERLRHGLRLSRDCLVWLQQTSGPDEVHEQSVEPFWCCGVHVAHPLGLACPGRVVLYNHPAYSEDSCSLQT